MLTSNMDQQAASTEIYVKNPTYLQYVFIIYFYIYIYIYIYILHTETFTFIFNSRIDLYMTPLTKRKP